MQSMIAKCTSSLLLIVAVLILSPCANALEASDAVKVTPLMKTGTTWEGRQIVYPQGKAEVTALRVEIAPRRRNRLALAYRTLLRGHAGRNAPGDPQRWSASRFCMRAMRWPRLWIRRTLDAMWGRLPVRLVVFYAGVKGGIDTVKGK